VVSFNSDSDELARRLNLEAAKAVRYGNLPEEEALDFVTINPARQLRIDQRVGSLEPGKDADFVVWSGHPLSTYSLCEQTWIDGRKYFDRAIDLARRREIAAERSALLEKLAKPDEKKNDKDKDKKKDADKPAPVAQESARENR
jgi:adenine deaminase